MKNNLFYTLAFLTTAFIVTTTGCEKNNDKNSNAGFFFLDAAKSTLPVFKGNQGIAVVKKSENKSVSAGDPWGIDNPLFLIFSMLQEYTPGSNDGTVGIDNIYNIFYMTGTFYDEAMNLGASIPEQHISSPFDLGYDDATYNVALNDITYDKGSAVRQEGSAKYALHSWMRENSGAQPATERGVLQGHYNKATHDLKIDLLSFLDSDVKKIGMRISIEGNDSTHKFTIKYIKYATNEIFAYGVGHGISKGEGNYFLLKFSLGVEENLTINNAYYCIEAVDTDQDMKNMDMAGVTDILPECIDYKTIVDNTLLFTKDDLPSSAADFNKGGSGTAPEGSMFLNFHSK